MGSLDAAVLHVAGAGVDPGQPSDMVEVTRAGSVKNHNLRVAGSRWYGKSVFLR